VRLQKQLNTAWGFVPRFSERFILEGLPKTRLAVDIPHAAAATGAPHSYERRFKLKDAEEPQSGFLSLEHLAPRADVYLNGVRVAGRTSGCARMSAEVSRYLKAGENRLLVVTDGEGTVGIYADVVLTLCARSTLGDVFLYATDVLTDAPTLYVEAEVYNPGGILTAQVFYGTRMVAEERVVATPKTQIPIGMRGVLLWDVMSPRLYEVRLTLSAGTETADERTLTFGFREVSVKGGALLLNGKEVKACGLYRDPRYPYVGEAMPAGVIAEDVRILKEELGCHVVHCPKPPVRAFFDACDRHGILVIEDVPVYAEPGNAEIAFRDVKSAVLQDRNHPSLLARRVLADPLAQALEVVKAYDHTRNHKIVFLDAAPTAPGLQKPRHGEATVILGTEAGLAVRRGERVDRQAAQAIAHAERQAAVGATGACIEIAHSLCDYPEAGNRYAFRDGMCYTGVLDAFRIPKPAAAAYAMQARRNVLVVAGTTAWGEYPDGRPSPLPVFSGCDEVRLYRNGVHLQTLFPKADGRAAVVWATDYFGADYDKAWGTGRMAAARKRLCKSALMAARSPSSAGHAAWGFSVGERSTIRSCIDKYANLPGDFEFFGYANGMHTCTVVLKREAAAGRLHMEADAVRLYPGTAYEATRVVVSMLDADGNPCAMCRDVVSVACGEGLVPVTPAAFALFDGTAALWVRTAGKTGTFTLTAACADQTATVQIQVMK
jgi:beta-galactosidase